MTGKKIKPARTAMIPLLGPLPPGWLSVGSCVALQCVGFPGCTMVGFEGKFSDAGTACTIRGEKFQKDFLVNFILMSLVSCVSVLVLFHPCSPPLPPHTLAPDTTSHSQGMLVKGTGLLPHSPFWALWAAQGWGWLVGTLSPEALGSVLAMGHTCHHPQQGC